MGKAEPSRLFTMRMRDRDRRDLEAIARARGKDINAAEMIRQLIAEELGRTKFDRALARHGALNTTVRPKAVRK